MAVGRENIETLQGWLADGSPVRSARSAATVVEKLAALAFNGDADWPDNADHADEYRDALQGWLADDSGTEARFVALTSPGSDAGAFLDWFLPVVLAWERDDAQQTAAEGHGFANPSFDGTPGTEFYRVDEASGAYLYSSSEQGEDWAGYDERRYSERTRDDDYRLEFRFDRRDDVYEWYDDAGGTWRDQAWADSVAAGRDAADAPAPVGEPAADWDENWEMFYRVGPDGVYEFADAVTPGDKSSGCGDVWLSSEQVLARDAGKAADTAEAGDAADHAAVQSAARAAVEAALDSDPQLKQTLTEEDIASVIANLTQEMLGDLR